MMRRRFLVAIDDETSQDVASFMNYIKENHFGWWHWFSNVWLLVTTNHDITTNQIRDELVEICGDKSIFVSEVQPITWSNFGPQGNKTGDEKDISQWSNNNWS